ncbi:TonB-dependent receptor [Labrys wisconsinensis]|uniref:Iron complex outermembrane receptor protein n=1 Tax=Labrys wisconsinensis TaxID=425677 RepID=A0ABU0JCF2_9HYPH|nr:TonB-dependent receptor [Labrys wisconsinensis]MDQ0471965.1 iron complex outermembrane receptor protein [Labrys wisconsinensis]
MLRHFLLLSSVAIVNAALLAPARAQDAPPDAGGLVLPGIDVIDTAPTGGAIARDKVPAEVQTLSADDFAKTGSAASTEALFQRLPGVTLSDVQGNGFLSDLYFRGFDASPLQGTSQGLAIYQNGVRINETFGDTVNWDLIPEEAIDRADLWTNNPAFGLNALGGALNLTMKNGFTFQGLDVKLMGGSNGRIQGSMQYGKQIGPWGLYVAIDGLHDDGWRDFSPSELKRAYADLGYKVDGAEFHLNATAADNSLGVVGPTPVQMLDQRYGSVYTSPQTTTNKLFMLDFNGKVELSPTWTVQADLYFRHFEQAHVDGNDTDASPDNCPSSLSGFICLSADDFPAGTPASQLVLRDAKGNPIPASVLNGNTPASLDRTWTKANTEGGSLQFTNTDPLFGFPNHFTIGAAVDHGNVDFRADSELGIMPPDLSVIGTGIIYHTDVPGGISPVDLKTESNTFGLYAIDTLDLTSRLSVTAGGRYNYSHVDLQDQLGDSLDGSHTYQRFNPLGGLTFKITPDITAYAGYSEANRAPTPLELGCADPAHPCLLEGFLVSDPSLKQVVSRTYEAGLRGKNELWGGQLKWSAGLYRTDNSDDIVNIPSVITGRGYYANVGDTRRQGAEVSAQYGLDRWMLYANYAYVDATYRSAVTLASPNNPAADDDGNIQVHPGDRLPAIPANQFKIGAEYKITPEWTVGGNVVAASGQYFVGDDSNQNKKLGGYAVANIYSSYQVTDHFKVFGMINNLFDRHYATYGTFFSTDDIAFLGLTDPRSVTPAQPFAVYGGVEATF